MPCKCIKGMAAFDVSHHTNDRLLWHETETFAYSQINTNTNFCVIYFIR